MKENWDLSLQVVWVLFAMLRNPTEQCCLHAGGCLCLWVANTAASIPAASVQFPFYWLRTLCSGAVLVLLSAVLWVMGGTGRHKWEVFFCPGDGQLLDKPGIIMRGLFVWEDFPLKCFSWSKVHSFPRVGCLMGHTCLRKCAVRLFQSQFEGQNKCTWWPNGSYAHPDAQTCLEFEPKPWKWWGRIMLVVASLSWRVTR